VFHVAAVAVVTAVTKQLEEIKGFSEAKVAKVREACYKLKDPMQFKVRESGKPPAAQRQRGPVAALCGVHCLVSASITYLTGACLCRRAARNWRLVAISSKLRPVRSRR
jgi:hypothetical protein